MRKYCLTGFLILLTLSFLRASDNNIKPRIRPPAVRGNFYPFTGDAIRNYLDKIFPDKSYTLKDDAIIGAIIVPHAGYRYSARTAAMAYKLVQSRKFKKIILIGPSHNEYLSRAAITDYDIWNTPMGDVTVSKELRRTLSSIEGLDINDAVFEPEHSLEVQLPFLQYIYGNKFSIFPILVNEFRIKKLQPLAEEIASALKGREDVLFVISTDMSHYFQAEIAVKMDLRASNLICSFDIDSIQNMISRKKIQLCGGGAVVLGMLVMKELGYDRAVQLDYSHSGEVTKNMHSVVGYGSFVIYKNGSGDIKKNGDRTMEYNKEQRKTLLDIARKTIELYVKEGKIYEPNVEDKALLEKRGVFVTLHKHGGLRGCIGNIMPVKSLATAVRDMAIQSASQDPRFNPVTEDELDGLDLEISVLTVPEKVASADDIVMKRDGVIVKKGFRQGVFLPQVADETGWNKEQFLNTLCYQKAGLSPDAWKDSKTELFTFRAEVFSEN